MSELRIDLVDEVTAFEPGEEILGVASWSLAEAPERVELRLFWHTSGKGETDVGVAEVVAWERPEREAAESFRLVAPDAPSSYAGRLVSITWSLATPTCVAPSSSNASVDDRTPTVAAPGAGALWRAADPKCCRNSS